MQAALGAGPNASGGTVIDPNCDIFPVSVTLWPHTSGVHRWIANGNFQSAAPDVAMVPFNEAGCRLTITVKRRTSTELADPMAPHSVDRVLFVGEVVDDPVVGAIFKIEASDSCLRPDAVAVMCQG